MTSDPEVRELTTAYAEAVAKLAGVAQDLNAAVNSVNEFLRLARRLPQDQAGLGQQPPPTHSVVEEQHEHRRTDRRP